MSLQADLCATGNDGITSSACDGARKESRADLVAFLEQKMAELGEEEEEVAGDLSSSVASI